MAVEVFLAGVTLIKVAQPSVNLGDGSGILVDLGYSRNGVTVAYEDFFHDVPGDQNGGDDGPPIETQWLGSLARIRCELTKYDDTIFKALAARVAGTTYGSTASKTVGQLMFSGAKTTRVLLSNSNDTRNFNRCIIRAAIDVNYATKYTSPIIEFEAHADGNGVLHNTSSSTSFTEGAV